MYDYIVCISYHFFAEVKSILTYNCIILYIQKKIYHNAKYTQPLILNHSTVNQPLMRVGIVLQHVVLGLITMYCHFEFRNCSSLAPFIYNEMKSKNQAQDYSTIYVCQPLLKAYMNKYKLYKTAAIFFLANLFLKQGNS